MSDLYELEQVEAPKPVVFEADPAALVVGAGAGSIGWLALEAADPVEVTLRDGLVHGGGNMLASMALTTGGLALVLEQSRKNDTPIDPRRYTDIVWAGVVVSLSSLGVLREVYDSYTKSNFSETDLALNSIGITFGMSFARLRHRGQRMTRWWTLGL